MAKIKVTRTGSVKERILTEAAALFREKGFRAASLRELGERLGVEAPSLYNHIRSKAGLLEEICARVAAEFTAQMNELSASKMTATENIAALIRFHVRKMHDDFDFVFVADNEWRHLPKAEATQFLAMRRGYEEALTKLISAGVRRKEFAAVHPRITMLTLLAALRGPEFRRRQQREFSNEELEKNMLQHLLKGIIK